MRLFKKIIAVYRYSFEWKGSRQLLQLAEHGNISAQFALVKVYETENSAVRQNLVDAYVLYMIAYQKGKKEALECARSLELIMPSSQLSEAKGILTKLGEPSKECSD